MMSSAVAWADCEHSEQDMRTSALGSNDLSLSDDYLDCYRFDPNANLVRQHLRRLEIKREFETIIGNHDEAGMRDFLVDHPEYFDRGATIVREWANERSFNTYPNNVFIGETIAQQSAQSEQVCEQACSDETCQGYTFSASQKICWLWGDIRGRSPRGGMSSGSIAEIAFAPPTVLPTPEVESQPEVPTFNIFENTDLPNPQNSPSDYSMLRDTSLASCRSICLRDDRCRAFTHNGDANVCFLKSAYTQSINYPNATSGIKR